MEWVGGMQRSVSFDSKNVTYNKQPCLLFLKYRVYRYVQQKQTSYRVVATTGQYKCIEMYMRMQYKNDFLIRHYFNRTHASTAMDPAPCENDIYEEIKVEPIIPFENKCYGQVNVAAPKIENGNRKCKKGLFLFLFLLALLFAIAGACVAFSLEIIKLKSDVTSLNGQITSSFQQLHSYINRSYQQFEQLNESIDSTHEQLNKMIALQLNSSIDMLYQQLGQHNDSIDSAYRKLSEKLNTSIDILYQQSSQQNASVGKITQQLNTSVNMIYQQLNQQNTLIDSAYQQLRQEYTALDDRTQQLNTSTQLLFNFLEGPGGQYPFHPAASCAALPPSSPSGYYWVRASNGSAVSVYCDMTLSCGGVTGGWMRVAELDMTNSSHQCPSGLRQRNDTGKRTCVPFDSSSATCSSVTFLVNTFSYSKVCGRIIGYQYASTNAFNYNRNIDTYYVDGVSLTHGNPRQHIWTFAAAADENNICPCTNTSTPSTESPPEYVGNDYFCDTGSRTYSSGTFYSEDPLWDGAGCGPLSSCCSFNNPPWFYKQLSQHTTDDIEMRVCRNQGASNEDIALEMVDVFIQLI